MNDYLQVDVGGGLFAIIDEIDHHLVRQFTWHNKLRRNGQRYAYTNVPKTENWRDGYTYTAMHRMILLPESTAVINHRDGDGLNNRRNNLRICTQQENSWNMRSKGGTSIYKGVYFDPSGGSWKRPWRAAIRNQGKRKDLGRYSDEVDAACAYDRAALECFGAFAKVNFSAPSFPPETQDQNGNAKP